jgi:hypothetical protein
MGRMILGGFLASQVLMSCVDQPSALNKHDRDLILYWLQCEECTEGELDSVLALAHDNPAAVDTLAEDLLGGPSTGRRNNIEEQFGRLFDEDAANAAFEGSSAPVSRTAYVEHYLDNFVNLYRARAALALGYFGDPHALAVLDSAANGVVRVSGDTLRADAQLMVIYARDTIPH